MTLYSKGMWSGSMLLAFILGAWIASEYAVSHRDAYCFYQYTDAHIWEGTEK